MSAKNYMFCSAMLRPSHCAFPETNLCCRNCVEFPECLKANVGSKVRPCGKGDLETDEICDFMI
jgi:hypothetical protein